MFSNWPDLSTAETILSYAIIGVLIYILFKPKNKS
jgi:hypothetical protein